VKERVELEGQGINPRIILKELRWEILNYIKLSQAKDHCLLIANMVVNLRVP
jgi:hypothetical protein